MGNEAVVLHIGDILKEGTFSARILYITTDSISVCLLDTTKLDIRLLVLSDVLKRIQNGKMSVNENNDNSIVDTDSFSKYEKEVYERRRDIIGRIQSGYGPDYLRLMGKTSKPEIDDLIRQYRLSRTGILKIIRKFLQSGCRYSSLVPEKKTHKNQTEYSKKTGNPGKYGFSTQLVVDDEVKGYFDEAIGYLKSGRVKNLMQAYNFMNVQHFTTKGTLLSDGSFKAGELYSITQRPTYKQLYYYCRKHISKKELDTIKTSAMEVRNNKRLLLGSSLTGVSGPGDYLEGDAVEVDLSLISLQDAGRAVSRPIVYALRDVYTTAIVAISVGFDNNSVIGLTSLMLNLGDDKKEYCRRYGITLPDERLWPSNFIPSHIRVDRSSDFKSKEFERICNELNITRELVSGGTGSLKGFIEQWFHQIHSKLNASTENNGLIEKRFDSEHHKEAVLNITEFTGMLIQLVLAFNQKHLDDYRATKDMIEKHIDTTPVILWQYGCEKYGSPVPITDRKQYFYTLMRDGNAKLSRKGICFKGLYYINKDDDTLLSTMYKAQNKPFNMEIRYDPRDAGSVWYSENGTLYRANLIEDLPGNSDYKGMTFKEVDDYMFVKKKMNAEARQRNDQINADVFAIVDTAVKNAAEKHPTLNSTKGIREIREKEKQDVSRNNSITKRLEAETSDADKSVRLTEASETKEKASTVTSSSEEEKPEIEASVKFQRAIKKKSSSNAGSDNDTADGFTDNSKTSEETKSEPHDLSDDELLDLFTSL